MRIGIACFFFAFALLIGNPISGALLQPPQYSWDRAIIFNAVSAFHITLEDGSSYVEYFLGHGVVWLCYPYHLSLHDRPDKGYALRLSRFHLMILHGRMPMVL